MDPSTHLIWIDYLIVPIALVITGTCAWTDLGPMLPHLLGRVPYEKAVSGRIANRLILLGLGIGLLWHLFTLIWISSGYQLMSHDMVRETSWLSYWPAVALNSALGMGIGFLLWALNLWAAGDAKLFGFLCLIVPLAFYSNNYIQVFPSFVLFFNTFIVVFALLVLEFSAQILSRVARGRSKLLKESLVKLGHTLKTKWRTILKVIFLFLAIFTLIRILRHFARGGIEMLGDLNKTLIYVVLFLMFKPLTRLIQYKGVFIGSLVLVFGYLGFAFFFDETGEAKDSFLSMGWRIIALLLFRVIYDAYLKATDERRIPWSFLKPRMILSDLTLRKFQEREKFYKAFLTPIEPDGLGPRQVEALKVWYRQNEPDGEIGIARTIPFGPALFFGALITIIMKGLLLVF